MKRLKLSIAVLVLLLSVAALGDVEDDVLSAQFPLITTRSHVLQVSRSSKVQVSFQAGEIFMDQSTATPTTTTSLSLVFKISYMGATTSAPPGADNTTTTTSTTTDAHTVRYAPMHDGPWQWQQVSFARSRRETIDHCRFPSPLQQRWAFIIDTTLPTASLKIEFETVNTNPILAQFPVMFSQPGYVVASIPVTAPFADIALAVQFSVHLESSAFDAGDAQEFENNIWVDAATHADSCPSYSPSPFTTPPGAPKVVSTTLHLKHGQSLTWHVAVRSNVKSRVLGFGVAMFTVAGAPMQGLGFISDAHENTYRNIMQRDFPPPSVEELQYLHSIAPNRHVPMLRLAEIMRGRGSVDLAVILYHRAAVVCGEEAGGVFDLATRVLVQGVAQKDTTAEEKEVLLRLLAGGGDTLGHAQGLAAAHATTARVHWREQTVLSRGKMEDYDELAHELMLERQFGNAASIYSMIVAADGKDLPTAHHALGAALHQAGDVRAAAQAYEHAIHLNTASNIQDSMLMVRAAMAHMRNGMVERPLELLKEARTLATEQDEINRIDAMLKDLGAGVVQR